MWALLACAGGGGDGGPRPDPDPTTAHSGSHPLHSAPDDPPHSGAPHSALEVPDFAEPGPSTFTERDERWQPPGCGREVARRFFVPDAPATAVTVIVAHGFARTQDEVVDLARHLASWGIPAATTTSCHAFPFDNSPTQDAVDLRLLADDAGAAERLFVGHSAGGLRAVLAGAAEPQVAGVLGLDLVDLGALAATAAPSVAAPLAGLAGEPSRCNALGEGAAVYAAVPGSPLLHVTDADHCDFEWPTDELCEVACNDPADLPEAQVQATVRGFATAWVVWRAGVDPLGEEYWVPGGAAYEAGLASGAIR